jgi:hypothetical protein
MIWGLIDLMKIKMLLPGRPDNFDIPHDLNPGSRSLGYSLAQNLARLTRETISIVIAAISVRWKES